MMLPRPPALRPRWTVTYALVSAVLVYSGYFVLAGMPLFSHPLPHYSGQYDVGTIDIESPVPRRNITNAVFKDTGRPAFQLETVLFSLYYPAVNRAVSRVPHHHWLPKPIGLQGEGYARLAKINNPVTNNIFTFALWMLAGSTTIPAQVDIPIHGTARTYHDYDAERPVDEYGLPKFPVIVFSHGTATSRTSYTHYCAELASRGYVVAAIEHRDGSGPGSIIMNEKQPPKFFFHVSADMIDPKPESADFKAMQLAMRQAEVEETVRVLRDVNNGSGRAVLRRNARLEGQDLAEWAGRLNMDRVIVGGHSFGATLALQTLKGAPSKQLPFVGAIVLDPGKHSGPLNDDISVPTLIVNSQSWSARHSLFQGRPHFTVVKDIVRKIVDEKKKYAWFMTAKGTTHPSVTDAPLIEPFLLSWATGATIDAREGVLQYVKVSEQFLQYLDSGHRRSILREETTHEEYDDAHPRASNPKVAPYWQIHMAPSTACPVPGYCGLDDD